VSPEIRVERRFHYFCVCGTTTVTANSTATCAGCEKSFVVRRVKKRAWIPGFGAYYGVVLSTVQPETAKANDASGKRRRVETGDLVRVGPFKPDGITPHPHAGAVGHVMDIFNGHAHVVVMGGHHGICVSVSCLEAAAPDALRLDKYQ
jgi:hypothetical protein